MEDDAALNNLPSRTSLSNHRGDTAMPTAPPEMPHTPSELLTVPQVMARLQLSRSEPLCATPVR